MKTILRWILYWYAELFGDGMYWADSDSRKARFLAWVYDVDLEKGIEDALSSGKIELI